LCEFALKLGKENEPYFGQYTSQHRSGKLPPYFASLKDMETFSTVMAPFEGVITRVSKAGS